MASNNLQNIQKGTRSSYASIVTNNLPKLDNPILSEENQHLKHAFNFVKDRRIELEDEEYKKKILRLQDINREYVQPNGFNGAWGIAWNEDERKMVEAWDISPQIVTSTAFTRIKTPAIPPTNIKPTTTITFTSAIAKPTPSAYKHMLSTISDTFLHKDFTTLDLDQFSRDVFDNYKNKKEE
ncbi:2670_t:CDS:2 [Ambispora gerdemannii]|uniref:2670_t:CDS:1 n=1 Tax=Ambispora gerdemannii TaxID=144530 RepID=A0A9N9AEM0_9GLOM|nr:2670_t:CDS:2 [Ambispora gerdemannii]